MKSNHVVSKLLKRSSMCGLLMAGLSHLRPPAAAGQENGDSKSPHPPTQVWFLPNAGSRDMPDLFSHPEQWQRARSQIQVFTFFVQQILSKSEADCRPRGCGKNFLGNFVDVQAFSKLRSWGIDTALECGAVKPWDCTATQRAAPQVKTAIRSVQAAGGSVRYIDLDEPFDSGKRVCHQDMEETAFHYAGFVKAIHETYPDVVVGDTEPYPVHSIDTLKRWVQALESQGVKLPYIHLDVNVDGAKVRRVDVRKDLKELKTFLDQRGIPLGVIFWAGHEPEDSDQDNYQRTMQWIRAVNSAVRPAHLVFETWVWNSAKERVVPANLPESGPNVYSHTRLINDGLAVFSGSK